MEFATSIHFNEQNSNPNHENEMDKRVEKSVEMIESVKREA